MLGQSHSSRRSPQSGNLSYVGCVVEVARHVVASRLGNDIVLARGRRSTRLRYQESL